MTFCNPATHVLARRIQLERPYEAARNCPNGQHSHGFPPTLTYLPIHQGSNYFFTYTSSEQISLPSSRAHGDYMPAVTYINKTCVPSIQEAGTKA